MSESKTASKATTGRWFGGVIAADKFDQYKAYGAAHKLTQGQLVVAAMDGLLAGKAGKLPAKATAPVKADKGGRPKGSADKQPRALRKGKPADAAAKARAAGKALADKVRSSAEKADANSAHDK